MTRTDDNVAIKRRRALAAMFVAVAGASSCNSPTGNPFGVDVELRFENTLDAIYWMEVGRSSTTAPTLRFNIYPNAVKLDTLENVATGVQIYVEMSQPPQVPGQPRPTWNASCTLGSVGFAAREVRVRVEVENNIPALACVGW